jgi:hypothetical protein
MSLKGPLRLSGKCRRIPANSTRVIRHPITRRQVTRHPLVQPKCLAIMDISNRTSLRNLVQTTFIREIINRPRPIKLPHSSTTPHRPLLQLPLEAPLRLRNKGEATSAAVPVAAAGDRRAGLPGLGSFASDKFLLRREQRLTKSR